MQLQGETRRRGVCPPPDQRAHPPTRERDASLRELERFFQAHAAFGLATVWADIDRPQLAAGADPGEGAIVEYMGRVARRIIDGEFDG